MPETSQGTYLERTFADGHAELTALALAAYTPLR